MWNMLNYGTMKKIKVILKQHRQDNFNFKEEKDVLTIFTNDRGLSETIVTTNVFIDFYYRILGGN